jgi:hypothetical protein
LKILLHIIPSKQLPLRKPTQNESTILLIITKVPSP